jgi:hypothetical protein
MAKKTSNLKVVQEQTLSEAELQAKAEREKEAVGRTSTLGESGKGIANQRPRSKTARPGSS